METPGKNTVFSWTQVLDTFMDDKEAVLTVLKHFIERTTIQIESLPTLEKNENWEEARKIAHNIKGAALTISDIQLGNAAETLEMAYKNIDKNTIKTASIVLQQNFERFKEEANRYIN